jgi:uncharacterized protein YbjT (DUF2867 family)
MHNQKVEASVFGATGLVGSRLIEYLKKDPDFVQVNLVVRSPIKLNAKKIKIHKINLFKKSEIFKTLKTSKVVFLSIGTTMSKVKGDIDRYERIDFGITKDVADSCKELGVDKLILVSSSGADLNSKSFYLKLKGKIEKYVSNINLKSVSIIRPSLLLGKRNEKRFGEKLAQIILPKISFLMPSKYKPISAEKVAKAMIQLSKTDSEGVKIFNYAEIINLLDK